MRRQKAYPPSDSSQGNPSSTSSRGPDPHRSKHFSIPSLYMSPVSFLNPKPKTDNERYRYYYSKPDEALLLKKYIGKKKVTYVAKPKQIAWANHHLKLIQEVKFLKGKLIKSGFRCLGDKVILRWDIALNCLQRKRLMSPYLKKITLLEDSNLSILRYTRFIKELSLTLDLKQNPRVNMLIFKNLQALETFNFNFTKPPKNSWSYRNDDKFEDRQDYLAFFLELIQLTSLKTIHLDFSSYIMDSDFLVNLAEIIEQVDTYQWYLKAKVERLAITTQIPTSGVLRKIDFLGLDMDGSLECDEYQYAPPKLSKLRPVTDQRKRVLDLSFRVRGKAERVNLNELLNRCPLLQGLYIRSLGDNLIWVPDEEPINMDQFQVTAKKKVRRKKGRYFTPEEIRQQQAEEQRWQQELNLRNTRLAEEEKRRKEARKMIMKAEMQNANWASQLTDVILNFNKNSSYNSDKSGESFNTLLQILNEKSKGLKSLNMFCCASHVDWEIEKYGKYGKEGKHRKYGYSDSSSSSSNADGRFDSVITFPEHLVGMTSLESLELSSGQVDKDLEPMLRSMKNLKKFTFHLYGEKDNKAWDDQFPFDAVSQVNEFRLVVHKDMRIVGWGKQFVKKLAQMQNLQILEIKDNTKQQINVGVFSGLLIALGELKELRRVVVHTKVSPEKKYDESEYLMSDQAQRLFTEARKTILDDITNGVKKIIERNKDIQEIDIKEIRCYNIGRISYKKKHS